MKKVFLLFVLAFSLSINAQEKSEVVKKALVVAEKTENFVIEQAPMLLQEFYGQLYTSVAQILFLIDINRS